MKDACDEVHASGGVADVDSSILLDTDVDFADIINPSVFCNDDNSSVSCDANVDSSVFSDADIVDISVSCDLAPTGIQFLKRYCSMYFYGQREGFRYRNFELILPILCRKCTLEKTDPNKFAEFRATHEPECQIIH